MRVIQEIIESMTHGGKKRRAIQRRWIILIAVLIVSIIIMFLIHKLGAVLWIVLFLYSKFI